jgi:hypothetical protein
MRADAGALNLHAKSEPLANLLMKAQWQPSISTPAILTADGADSVGCHSAQEPPTNLFGFGSASIALAFCSSSGVLMAPAGLSRNRGFVSHPLKWSQKPSACQNLWIFASAGQGKILRHAAMTSVRICGERKPSWTVTRPPLAVFAPFRGQKILRLRECPFEVKKFL